MVPRRDLFVVSKWRISPCLSLADREMGITGLRLISRDVAGRESGERIEGSIVVGLERCSVGVE